MATIKTLLECLGKKMSDVLGDKLSDVRESAADAEFIEIFSRTQDMLDAEVLHCLFVLSKPYSEVFILARRYELKQAQDILSKADKLRGKFEFAPLESNIFKVFTYPKISYLQYKLNNIPLAKSYTSKLINILQHLRDIDFLFEFSLYQQRINYAKLSFGSNAIVDGFNLSVANILEMMKRQHQLLAMHGTGGKYQDSDLRIFREILEHNMLVSLSALFTVITNHMDVLSKSRKISINKLQSMIDAEFGCDTKPVLS